MKEFQAVLRPIAKGVDGHRPEGSPSRSVREMKAFSLKGPGQDLNY